MLTRSSVSLLPHYCTWTPPPPGRPAWRGPKHKGRPSRWQQSRRRRQSARRMEEVTEGGNVWGAKQCSPGQHFLGILRTVPPPAGTLPLPPAWRLPLVCHLESQQGTHPTTVLLLDAVSPLWPQTQMPQSVSSCSPGTGVCPAQAGLPGPLGQPTHHLPAAGYSPRLRQPQALLPDTGSGIHSVPVSPGQGHGGTQGVSSPFKFSKRSLLRKKIPPDNYRA